MQPDVENEAEAQAGLRPVQILLTLTCLEFFGPPIRDIGASHAMNPDWVGHARLHLVWLLGFMLFSGIANIYLIWFRRPFELRNLWLSVMWQGANLGGFWLSIAAAELYGGEIVMEGIHMQVLGYDENVVGFTVLTTLVIVATRMLRRLDMRAS